MTHKRSSESGLLSPRLAIAMLLCAGSAFLAMFSFAADPPNGTLSDTSGPVTFTAGPFFQANQSPVFEVDSGPRCDGAAFPCDTYKLTLNLPSGYAAAHPKAVIRATMSWADTGSGQSNYDIYIFKTPRSDCSPNDCTQPDGSEQADAQASTSRNPEFAYVAVTSDTQTYTVIVLPNTPTGETVTVKLDLLPGSEGALTAGFGGPDPSTPGVPRYMNFYPPHGSSAESSQGEFNIGYNPHTGRIMTMNLGPIWRITPAELLKMPECCEGLWEDKSSTVTDTGLDPILWTDQVSGRTFASNSTAGANAVYAYSDDDGDSWIPVGFSPPNGGADHETIGSGPYPTTLATLGTPVNQGEAVYYCSQDVVGPASCQRSDTLGASYGPGVFAYNGQGPSVPNGSCGGLHGHLHVAPDGTVWLPVSQCANSTGPNTQGGAFSTDGGTTWNEFKVPNALSQQNGADPSIAIDSNSIIYYSYVKNEPVAQGLPPEGHAHVAVGKRNDDNTITWLNDTDIGVTQGIKNAAEIEAVGGSSGRAAVGFIGADLSGDYQQLSFPGEWYAFIATTYDQGKTWVTVNATPNDPVQNHTGIWQQGGAQTDRNLLDFDEITIDKNGRVLFGYSDGCVTTGCIAGTAPNDFVANMRVARQTGGKTLFASFDAQTDTTAAILAKAPCLSGTRDASGSHLSWKEPDNGGSEIIDYYVYRATAAGGYDFQSPIGHTGGAKTTFTDATADPTVKDYFYVVKAITAVGFGAASNEVDLKVSATGPAESVCALPGLTELTDASGDSIGPAGTDLLSFQLSQPYANGGEAKFVFTITTDPNPNALTPPGSGWYVAMKIADSSSSSGFRYAGARMDGGAGSPTFSSYVPSANTSGGVDGRFVASSKPAEAGSHYDAANGKIVIIVKASDLGFTPGTRVLGFVSGSTQTTGVVPGAPISGTEVYDSMPDSLTFTGSYTVDANSICAPDLAPTAMLTSTPDHGPAPLTVTLSGAGSTDPDPGDSVVSYTFEFGDGSPPVTQSSPTITHTYGAAGEYPARLSVNDSHGKGSTNIALVNVEVDAVLRNISTRGNVQTGDNVLIGGFIVTGNDARRIIVRAIGPSQTANGEPVAGALQDPTLELHDSSGATIATNDNWKVDDKTGQSQQTLVEGTDIPPKDDRESALVMTLNPGHYTAIVRGKNNATGIGLVEAYDLNPFATSKLSNISTRGSVAGGDNVMIGGFIVGPQNAAPTTVLIRGLGPSLTAQGVPNAMQDPTLELHDGNGNTLKVNDNWQDSQQADIENTGIPPSDAREAAIVTEIAPGNYTAILAGKNNSGGNALVEIYNLP